MLVLAHPSRPTPRDVGTPHPCRPTPTEWWCRWETRKASPSEVAFSLSSSSAQAAETAVPSWIGYPPVFPPQLLGQEVTPAVILGGVYSAKPTWADSLYGGCQVGVAFPKGSEVWSADGGGCLTSELIQSERHVQQLIKERQVQEKDRNRGPPSRSSAEGKQRMQGGCLPTTVEGDRPRERSIDIE